jgi:predicted RNA-binding protein Jag
MSKLSSALGSKYEANRVSVMTRQFELGNHIFKVRVPSVGEIEKIYDYFKNPNQDDVQKNYDEISKSMIELKDAADDTVQFLENDIIVDGRSMMETAKNKTILQYRITEYIKLLISETGETLDDLQYSDVEEEFPLPIQIQIVDKINEVIAPDYKEIREK